MRALVLLLVLCGCSGVSLPCVLDAGVNAGACPANRACSGACAAGTTCRYVLGSCESIGVSVCAADGGWSCP